MSRHAVVVGAGVGGLSAALSLSAAGCDVTVLEAGPTLGGLVSGFTFLDRPLERFYHYVLPQETDTQQLIVDHGFGDQFEWFPGSIGILTGGKVWPFTSPIDLLRFRPLGFADRLRAGVGALRLGRTRDWQSLDGVRARDWLTSLTSAAVTDVVWDPLLRAKFGPAAPEVPAAWMWARLEARRKARKGVGEKLGYLRGGFAQLFDAVAERLDRQGVQVRTSTPVRSVRIRDGRAVGVDTDAGAVDADAVLFTGPMPRLTGLVDDDVADDRWKAARGLGALCVVFDVPRAVAPVYWTNVCDRDVPFGGIIEHTNLVPTSWYGGRHVVYLSRYFTAEEAIASADPMEEAERWLAAVCNLFPHVRRSDVGELYAFKTDYAAPLVSVPYLPKVAPIVSHVPGLYVATTAQIYPEDRGMNEGIKQGAAAARLISD